MNDKIIIGIVVAVVLGAHWWLFKWVKFKMDEGAIVNLLTESKDQEFHSTPEISKTTNISESRVSVVCNRSKVIGINQNEIDSWCLN